MPLPDLIEIVPLDKHVKAEITVPGSKSITNRALILAALAEGETILTGALWSEDTQIMVEALLTLGFDVKVDADPEEFCNRMITVWGYGGRIPREGTAEKPVEIFVGNAGTAARFLSAMVCLGNGVYRLSGVPRMHERPQAALFKAIRELGYRVNSSNDKLPAVIYGGFPAPPNRTIQSLAPKFAESLTVPGRVRSCTVSIEQSSQFASALLLCAKVGGWEIKIEGENAEESPYVVMTSKLIEAFPNKGGEFKIEPDASSGSYFLAASKIAPDSPEFLEYSPAFKSEIRTKLLSRINVNNWPQSDWQIDENFADFVTLGVRTGDMIDALTKAQGQTEEATKKLIEYAYEFPKGEISRLHHLGDSIMTAIVLTPLMHEKIRFTDLGRLRVQECERVMALRTELTRCGARVVEEGDTLTVYPSKLHGAEIETYNDHRMAMCFAILGLKVAGIKIQNPACVKKTFPNFFQKLAAPPPHGLGATILDGRTGRKLGMDELFAE